MKQPYLFYFSAILFTFLSFQCNTSFKSFDKTGGILYTFQLPKNASLDDVEQIKNVFSKRIAVYIKQQPKYIYDEATQQLSVGVPKSLTSKSVDLTKKLLLARGTFRTLPQYPPLIEQFNKINEITLSKGVVLSSDDTSRIGLYELLDYIGDWSYSHGHADNSDTALIRAIIEHETFASLFENDKNLIWAWQDELQDRSSLHPYDLSLWNKGILETMIEKCELGEADYGIFLSLKLNEEGTRILAKQTKTAASNQSQVHFFLDDKLIMSPTVMESIEEGQVQIGGEDDTEKMFFYQAVISSGKLPFKLELIKEDSIIPISMLN